MYQPGETVWAVIYSFDTPKKCVVVDTISKHEKSNYGVFKYIVKYKHKEYTVKNVDVYPTQIDAEIFWAIFIQQQYYVTLQHPDIFLTDDFERADRLATQLLSKYAETSPHLLLKYL